MCESLKYAEPGDVDADVDIDPVYTEEPAYPENESEYYTVFYL